MLTITQEASEAIEGILAADSIPDGSVLRIGPAPEAETQAGLVVSVIDSPPPEDQTVEEHDVAVSVDPSVAPMLDDKQLDAQVVGDQVNFTIAQQPG